MPIIWHPCNTHPEQDRMYGQNFRVCNRTDKQGSFKCTVCGKDITKGGGNPKTDDKDSKKK